MNLIFDAPINNLSFGNVSVNILRELHKRKAKLSIFAKNDPDFSAFDKLSDEFKGWVQNGIDYRFHNLNKEHPTLNLWHINGAEKRISPNQYLLTFFELDQPTFVEKKIVDMQNKVFLSNPEAVEAFKKIGCTNVEFVPMGFDPDFKVKKSESKIVEGKTHFILMGKFEKRKHTKKIIQTWLKKYGNNNKYLLSCCVVNPFIKHEQMNALLSELLEGKHCSNINFLPHLKTNTEVNHLLNSADIDLTGLSGAEGWNLPAFNATALGKWSIVQNHTAHKAWANKDNSILIDAGEKEPAADGLFFTSEGQFNQGNIYQLNEDRMVSAMEEAENKCKNTNTEGLKLQNDFSYEKTVDIILEKMELTNG